MSTGLKANADGSAAIQVGGSDAITITSGLAVSINGGVNYPLMSGTAVASTSGASIDFTGIPSTAKCINVMFSGVSTSGASKIIVQLGDAGGIETSGYVGSISFAETSIAASNFSTGFIVEDGTSATAVRQGLMRICLLNSLTWIESSNVARSDSASICVGAGTKTLSATLDRVRITTVNGTDTFDAGSINIMWE